jgi:hypothetical protein
MGELSNIALANPSGFCGGRALAWWTFFWLGRSSLKLTQAGLVVRKF